jgi:hypothetical protein
MKAQHQTLQGVDAYRANLRLQCRAAAAKWKAVSALLSKYGHQQGHDPSGVLVLLVLAHIASALARTK